MSFALNCKTWSVSTWCLNVCRLGLDSRFFSGMCCELPQICTRRSISEELGCTSVPADTFQTIETMFPGVQSRVWLFTQCTAFLYVCARCSVIAVASCMELLLVAVLPLRYILMFAWGPQHLRWVLAICLAVQFQACVCLVRCLAHIV